VREAPSSAAGLRRFERSPGLQTAAGLIEAQLPKRRRSARTSRPFATALNPLSRRSCLPPGRLSCYVNDRVAFFSMRLWNASLLCAAVLALSAPPARAVVKGQIDNFTTGAQNWANGHASGSVALGGPAGASDQFLDVVADGSGATGLVTIFNRTQWLGNYITAGVTEIEMDLRNFSSGGVTLSIRLAFKQSTAGGGTPGYLTFSPFTLTNDGAWHHAVFHIDAPSMKTVNSPTPYNTLMAAPGEFRIINEAGTTNLAGDFVVARLGIDNVRAVPEPGAGWLVMAAGGASLGLRRRRGG
jgi:hypothetical protein